MQKKLQGNIHFSQAAAMVKLALVHWLDLFSLNLALSWRNGDSHFLSLCKLVGLFDSNKIAEYSSFDSNKIAEYSS